MKLIYSEKDDMNIKLKVLAKKKENTRRKLVVIAKKLRLKAKKLALTAEKKENVRNKLVATAEKKENVRNKLVVIAKQLAIVAKEKEDIRKKLAITAEALRLKAESIEQVEVKEEAILASINDGVVACDEKGRVVLFNKAAEILTGLLAKEAIGQHYSYSLKFIRESDEKKSDDLIGMAIVKGQATKMASHTMLIKKNGYKIPVSDSIAPVRNHQKVLIGCVIVFRDASEESRIDKAKTEFVSLASHQLRTPLTTVNWYSEMLLTGDVGPLNEKQQEYINEIYKGSKRMGNLVNALLDVSRMEMGTFTVEPEMTDIPALVQSVMDELRPQIDKKNLQFSGKYADNLPIINIDPKLLRMVFQNILSNSVKYTPDNGNINLELSLSDAQGLVAKAKGRRSSIMIKVSDTGYGIPQANQDKIFTKFFRADNVRAKETEGTGLGLYIVKGIIDQSGGRIWFESKEGKGTTFYLTLPIKGKQKMISTNMST
jgi:two-component system sensor histidine kinase VicK